MIAGIQLIKLCRRFIRFYIVSAIHPVFSINEIMIC